MLQFLRSSYFSGLLEAFSGGVAIANAGRRVYAVNSALSRLIGLAPKEFLSDKGLAQALAPLGKRRAFTLRFAKLLRNPMAEPDSPLISSYEHPDGRRLTLSLNLSPLIDHEKLFGIVVEVNDLTHIVAFHERERKNLALQNELQRQRIDALDHLAASIAHQLRNPMMTLAGLARLLSKNKGPDHPEEAYLQGIRDQAARLCDIVEAVSSLVRLPAPTFQICSIQDVLLDAVAQACQRIGPGAPLVCLVGIDGLIQLDALLLGQVLAELMVNAMEAMAQQAANYGLKLGWQEDERHLAIEVRTPCQDGLREQTPFVFDPFFTTKAVGVGMGLTKARRAVELMGGHLTFEMVDGPEALARIQLRQDP